ncbi:MAG: UDP-N-acetylmuramoyl-tripeptide--D-alanyl-D-alanine ligase [Nanoarchaeota archaeon]|nr:UDP-N-acetylmuramoyl-tripeptide--D-alanyl-D-alanine ligase [Nanoarchaeota archaeon]
MKSHILSLLEKLLKILARLTLKRYKPGIIGITGNVGKTSAKEAIRVVLERERRVRSASKNFNNEIGLPLTILGDWQDAGGIFFWVRVVAGAVWNLVQKNPSYPELLILEYGIDHPGDMKRLLEIARPNIGVVTPIGEIPVHVEFFAGREGLIREKTRLVKDLPATGFAILNADNEASRNMKGETRAHAITYGWSESADIRIRSMETRMDATPPCITCKLEYNGSFVPVRIEEAVGRVHAYAAAAGAAVGISFGINLVKISENLSYYKSPPGRLKIIEGREGSRIIDDTYNSSPLAFEEALDTMRGIKARRKIAVLGDMLELGRHSIEAHENAGKMVAGEVKILITVGARAKFIAEAARNAGLSEKSIIVSKTVGEAGAALKKILRPGDLVLIKGSQGVRMERIVYEVMANPDKAKKLLVRQEERWLEKPGLYD